MKKNVCCFIGSKPGVHLFRSEERDPLCIVKQKLRKEIEKLITEGGVSHFISGMERGAETIAAETVLELKCLYPQITLEAALPFEEQAASWTEEDRERYFSAIERSDKETMVSKRLTSTCMHKRNKYMLNCSDVLIAIPEAGDAEADKALTYAKSKGIETVIIEA